MTENNSKSNRFLRNLTYFVVAGTILLGIAAAVSKNGISTFLGGLTSTILVLSDGGGLSDNVRRAVFLVLAALCLLLSVRFG